MNLGNIKNSVTILIVVHKQELWTLKRPSLVLRYFEKSDATPGTSFKAKTMKVVIKELRFGPNTDDHDYNFKLKHAEKFLNDGAKVKAFVFFKGRSILFKEKGEILLLRLAQDLEELGIVEQMPRLEGKRMTMFIAPKTQGKRK